MRYFHTLIKVETRLPIQSALLLSCCLFAAACASTSAASEATIGPSGTAESQLAEAQDSFRQTSPKLEQSVWSSWWILGLVLAIVGVGAYGAFRLRINAAENRSRELEEQVDLRTQALEERTRELERRGKELEALFQADEKLLSRLDLEEVLQALVDTAIEILEADKGGVMVWDSRAEELVVRASKGFTAESFAGVKFLPGRGVAGRVFQTGEPIAVENTRNEPRATKQLIEAEGIGAFLQVPIKIGDEVYGVFSADYLKPRSFDQSTIQLLYSLASHAALAIDSARLHEHTTDQVAQLTALQETTRALASTLELDGLLTLIIQQATLLLNADGGMINLVREDEPVDEVVAAAGMTAGTIGMYSPLEDGLSGWVTLHNEPVIVNQIDQDERLSPRAPDLFKAIQSTAVAPLAVKNEVIGSLVVVGTEEGKGDFDEAELETLVAFANQAAIAIDNARLYSRAAQMAAVEERARLARDLHDAVTQTLFSASLIAEALPIVWKEDPVEGDQLLQELRHLNRGALAEMRSLLMELRPDALEAAELPDLMHQLGEAIVGRSGIEVRVETEVECSVPTEVHLMIYRIAQEALNNIIKHANASQVEVFLKCTESGHSQNGAGIKKLELRVHDDGQGFDPVQDSADGFGLTIIRERVDSIGASLELESEPGAGTTLDVIWEGE